MITLAQLRAIIPSNPNPEAWYGPLVDMFEKYDITTVNRIAGFLAQCGHESRDFTALEENLNYSASSLYRVFGKRYFPTEARARAYHRQPEKIANYVYMDRNRSRQGALGNTEPGDGWKFRGRGIKQLTGRNNYAAFGRSVGMSADEAADYVATKKGALESACWFWSTNGLNRYADANDIVGMSRRINGGTIGLNDRKRRYARAKAILSGSSTSSKPLNRTLRRGTKGNDVRRMQRLLGITADGIFGSDTEASVKRWQSANGLVPDGILGPNSQEKLFS